MTTTRQFAAAPENTATEELPPDLTRRASVIRASADPSAVANVLLTEATRTETDRYSVEAHWPYYRATSGAGPGGSADPGAPADPLLLVETVRRASCYLSHLHYGVPHHRPSVLTSVDYTSEPAGRRAGTEAGGSRTVRIDITCTVDTDHPDLFGMSLDAGVYVGGQRVGQVGMGWQALSPGRCDVVHRVSAPAVIGLHDRDVTLAAAGENSWELRPGTGCSAGFGSGCGHIPGMTLLEAFHRAASLMASRSGGAESADRTWALASGAVAFEEFGEPGTPVIITATPAGEQPRGGQFAVRVAARQGDDILATAALLGSVTTTRSSTRSSTRSPAVADRRP